MNVKITILNSCKLLYQHCVPRLKTEILRCCIGENMHTSFWQKGLITLCRFTMFAKISFVTFMYRKFWSGVAKTSQKKIKKNIYQQVQDAGVPSGMHGCRPIHPLKQFPLYTMCFLKHLELL